MPPKIKFTKEEIADKAYELVRREGIEQLSARGLAKELGTSTAPIFTAFRTIEEVQLNVKQRAWKLYSSYIDEGLQSETPFKGEGLKYIQFAKYEPSFFKLLFMYYDMDTTVAGYYPGNSDASERVLEGVRASYGLSEEGAKRLYNHLSVYTHGLAVMFALGRSMFTDKEVSCMLTEVFNALVRKENQIE